MRLGEWEEWGEKMSFGHRAELLRPFTQYDLSIPPVCLGQRKLSSYELKVVQDM